ncbi:MAG: hypothetical protein ABSH32_30260 [Bryobacteraceae bacterium]|jgi:hypothetical protein
MGQVDQILAVIPNVLIAIGVYGIIFCVIWKFYQILSKINDNLGGIKQAIAGIPVRGREDQGPPRAEVLPTAN